MEQGRSPVRVIHDLVDFEAPWEDCVLTLGVFDGMHRGHQALVDRVKKRARGRERVLVTYHPHPDLVLGKRKSVQGAELFTYDEKIDLLRNAGLDSVVFLPFDLELARMTAWRYLKEILLGKLRAKHIVIGYDQRFGRGRKGDYAFLKKMSRRYDFKVDQIGAVKYRREPVSSSRIRDFIRAGEIKAANRILGHEFFVTGLVERGDQRGAKIGYPTANLSTADSKIMPATGVYAGRVRIEDRLYRTMVNIGTNPTFGMNQGLRLEANILNFSGELYGSTLRIYLQERLRDEVKFDSVDALVKQLDRDREKTMQLVSL